MASYPGAGPSRVRDGTELGRAGLTEGLFLGSAAILPFLLAAAAAWWGPIAFLKEISFGAIAWSGALLTFFAGVRRGLTFSEAVGPAPHEILSMLWMFFCGVIVLLCMQLIIPAILFAIIGFISVGVLDVCAAREREAPRYFVLFRSIQTGIAILSLAIILARDASL